MKRPQVLIVPGTQDSQLPWKCPAESYGKGSMRDNIIRYTRLRETDPCIDFIVQYFWYDEEAGEMKTDTIRDTEIWPERFVPEEADRKMLAQFRNARKALQERWDAEDKVWDKVTYRCTAHELNVPCDICDAHELFIAAYSTGLVGEE